MKQPNLIEDVRLFHKTFGHPIPPTPQVPVPQRQCLRSKLIRDEYIKEFVPAWDKCADAFNAGTPIAPTALAEFGDAIADVIYFLIGTALEYGIPLAEIWEAVQAANMAKLWTRRELEETFGIDEEPYHHLEFIAAPHAGWTATITAEGAKGIAQCWQVKDETGKVRKPPSWKEPDIIGIITKHLEKR